MILWESRKLKDKVNFNLRFTKLKEQTFVSFSDISKVGESNFDTGSDR